MEELNPDQVTVKVVAVSRGLVSERSCPAGTEADWGAGGRSEATAMSSPITSRTTPPMNSPFRTGGAPRPADLILREGAGRGEPLRLRRRFLGADTHKGGH